MQEGPQELPRVAHLDQSDADSHHPQREVQQGTKLDDGYERQLRSSKDYGHKQE